MSRPNILLIVTDEQRAIHPQAPGFELPNLERIAARGVTFERFYGASTMCSSARSVLYTGHHVPETGIYDNDNMPYVRPLDPALGTVGTRLRSAGYHCAYQGKWHLSNAYQEPGSVESTRDALEPYGFSEWNDWGDIDGGAWAGLKVDPVIAGQAAKWLRDRAPVVAAEQPWFLAVNFVNPHDIMSFDYGGRSDITLPFGLAHAVVVKPPADIPLYQRTWDVELPATVADPLTDAPAAVREYSEVLDVTFGGVPDPDAWRQGLSFYLNCMADVDRHVGVVLDALAASGQADRTVVVFTSDHGELAAGHGLRQKANLVYDENFHVPFVIAHPDLGSAAGSTSTAMGSAVDVVPTLLEIASADSQEATDGLVGHSLVPALDGRAVRDGVLTATESITTLDADFWRRIGDADFWRRIGDADAGERLQAGTLRPDFHKRGFLRGYTDERYSFGRYFSPLEPNRPRTLADLRANNDVVLYDRVADPDELTNLAADPAHDGLVDACRGKLEALIDAEVGSDDTPWVLERPGLMGMPAWHGDR